MTEVLTGGIHLYFSAPESPQNQAEIDNLSRDLLAIIGAHTGYDANFDPPKITVLSRYKMILRRCWPDLRKFHECKHVIAFYNTPNQTIFMSRFSYEDPSFWASVLVHELTHYVQDMNNTLASQKRAEREAEADALDRWFHCQCQREQVTTSSLSRTGKPSRSGHNEWHADEWQRIRCFVSRLAVAPGNRQFFFPLKPWPSAAAYHEYALGMHATGDYGGAFEIWSQLTRSGDSAAQYYIGVYFLAGYGRSRDMEQAIEWFRRAAIGGHMVAMFNLGVAYCEGEGIEQNFVEAVSWWKRAADMGHCASHYNLDLAYYAGKVALTEPLP